MNKFDKWLCRNRKKIYVIIIALNLFITIPILWRTIWKIFFQYDYVWDLSISISDLIQILIILTAIFGPLLVDFLKNRIYRPKISVMFYNDNRNVFVDHKIIFTPDKKESHQKLKNCWHYCLTIKNIGKTKLQDCEVVLTKIEKIDDSKKFKELIYPQINLKWLDHFRSDFVDINPEREYRLAILFFSETQNVNSRSENVFRIYDSADDFYRMIKLSEGFYSFDIKIYSSNAEIYSALLNFDFYVKEQTKDGKWKPSGSMFLFNNKARPEVTQEEIST